MARKKLTLQRKYERVMAVLVNTAGDIESSKKTAEVLGVVLRDIALCLAIHKSDHDDDMEIAQNWVKIEEGMLKSRAKYNGYRQAWLGEDKPAEGANEPKSTDPTKKPGK